MTDAAWLLFWVAVLGGGLGAVVLLHGRGLRTTHARDLLHVGTGVWVLGWPAWSSPAAPIALATTAAALTAMVPLASRRLALASRLEHSVSDGDERWGGLVLYTVAYAALTVVGLVHAPFPAAAGLLALSLGDGLGGLAGRHLGRHFYRAPGGKRKSLEGSAVVAVMAALGVAIAAWWLGSPVGLGVVAVLGCTAAVAEALSPRGTDNLIVPVAVWLAASVLT